MINYNALNRLTDLVHYQTTQKLTTISSFNYKLNAQGMRTGVTEVLDEARYLAYTYDNLNRLAREDSYDDSTMNPAADDGYTALYEYDLAGNRLGRQVTVVRNSSNPATNNILSTEYTEYDSGNRLRKEHSIDHAIFAAIPQGENDRIFAAADGQGGFGYKLPDSMTTIGQFKAFLIGLPSVWNRWLLIVLLVCMPIAFLWPTLTRWIYKVCRTPAPTEKPHLSLYHRSLCILFAYIFLIGPETVQTLAYTDIQYHQLSTQAWGHAGDYITYYYDANGSLTYKIYSNQDISGDPASIVAADTSLKYDKSEYNLQNRLSRLTQYSKPAADEIRLITEYSYNPDGIRVASKSYKTVNNGAAQDKTTTDYLIDPSNHTGYAQVLEEQTTSYNASDEPTTQTRIAYTIGDDIISQTKSDWTWNTVTSTWDLATPHDTEYLLYDGQGSTRQLVRPNKTVIENYNYDCYGVMLGGNPTPAAPAATKLLYTGEQFDTAAQSYYLRARYYNPLNGLFNQMDPYAGNTQDPQSLHKYLYCHANPVNGIDPTGMMEFTLVNLTANVAIMALISGIVMTATSVTLDLAYGVKSWAEITQSALFTFGATILAVMSTPFALALMAAVLFSLGVKALDEGLNKEDGVRIGTFLAVAILLSVIFKNCAFLTKSTEQTSFSVAETFKDAHYKEVTLQPGTILKRAFEMGKNEPISNYTTRGKTAAKITSTEDAIQQLNLEPSGMKPTHIATLKVTRPVKAMVGKIEGGGEHAFQYWVEDSTALELVGDPVPLK